MRSDAKTVAQYLKELPAERRAVVSEVRDLVRKHIPKGYAETMNWGMICYEIPLERFPDTYNDQPLASVAIAAQKDCYAIYLICGYAYPHLIAELKAAYKAMGRKIDMGKSCLRFKSLDDLPLEVIGKIVGSVSVKDYIAIYEASREETAAKPRRSAAAKPKAKPAVKPKAAPKRKPAAK